MTHRDGKGNQLKSCKSRGVIRENTGKRYQGQGWGSIGDDMKNRHT